MSRPSIYVAIASLDDEELIPTLKDLFAKAAHPERVHVGVAVQSSSTKWYKSLVKEFAAISPNIKHRFTKITPKNALEVLGVGQGRELSHSFYADEDYVLQVDSHSMFLQDWDDVLIGLLAMAKDASQNRRTILTAYAGNYFLDKDGNRTTEFPEGLNEHHEFYYPLYRQYASDVGLPAWDTVPFSRVSDAPHSFVPSPKFNANFAFGDKNFANNLGLDSSVVFFEEEIIQSVNLLASGWSLAFPNIKEAVVRHLYVAEGQISAVKRRSAASYIPEKEGKKLTERMQANYQDFLANSSLSVPKTDYERYANVSLKHGRLNADTGAPKSWRLEPSEKNCEENTVNENPNESTPAPEPVKKARPWDMLDPRVGRVDDKVKQLRMDFCSNCEFFISLTQQCKKCGCHMPWKTGLPHAECPVGKWSAVPDESSAQ
jgi:hypothetical protein